MTPSEARALRKEYLALIRKSKPNAFLTFNFGYKVRPENAQRPMKTFLNAMQRSVYGRDWAKDIDRAWPVAFGFFEHPDSNPHYHVVAKLAPDLLAAIGAYGADCWKRLVSRGQFDFESIYNLPGAINYCSKRLAAHQTFDDVWIYKDTRPCTIGASTLKVGRES